MTPRQQHAAWVAIVALGVLLPFAPAVLGLRTLAQRDTDQLYAPVRTLVVEALRDGRLPLWSPYEGTGKPLFAEGIHSVLHPLSLLGAAVAPSSIDFLILAYLVAAALGAFLLARTLDTSEPAAAGGGLAYALSGYSVSMTGNLVFLAGLSTLPWLLAAARSAGEGSRWGIVLTALATASAFFSGDVQVALVGLGLGTLLAADAGGRGGAARALAGFAPGLLLAAVQILATYELLPFTFRGFDLEPWEKTRWALAPARILEWIVPGLGRGPLAEVPAGASGEFLDALFSESVYLGAPLVAAAAIGARSLIASSRRRTGLLLSGAAVLLLWLALGHRLGARQLLDWVPVWNRFRYSEKLMAPLALCLSALAAHGIDAFADQRLSRGETRALVAGSAAAAVAFLALLLAPGAADGLALRALGDAGPFYRATLAGGLPHLVLALAALVAIDRLRAPEARAPALAALVALAAAVAVPFGANLGSHEARRFSTPMRFEAPPPGPRLAQQMGRILDRSERQDYVEFGARLGSLFLHPSVNVAHRIDTIEPYGAFEPLRYTSTLRAFGGAWARAFRRFGLTHLALGVPYDDAYREMTTLAISGGALVQRDDALRFELWAVPHRPWAFFPRRAVTADRPESALRKLVELTVLGADETVTLEAGESPTLAPGRVLRLARATEALRVEAESEGPGLLVVQDAFWPGWKATIDGQPTGIFAADYLVRAVRWPPGRHTLEMVYDPPELRTGLALSAVGALLILILALLAVRR